MRASRDLAGDMLSGARRPGWPPYLTQIGQNDRSGPKILTCDPNGVALSMACGIQRIKPANMDERDRQNLLAAIVAVVLIALSLWLFHAWSEHLKMENCVLSGRRDCNPIPMDQ
jgi:hypothetical protein